MVPAAGGGDADPWADVLSMWSKPFLPNLMNTVVFLVETSQLVVCVVVAAVAGLWGDEEHVACQCMWWQCQLDSIKVPLSSRLVEPVCALLPSCCGSGGLVCQLQGPPVDERLD